MTSYNTDGTVGPWAREKLECLGKYLSAYTTILKKQSWCTGYIYVDAFAGAGKAPERKYDDSNKEQAQLLLEVSDYVLELEAETESYVLGSPKVALELKNPFSDYVFVEKSPKRVIELKGLQKEHSDLSMNILEGDANEQILQHLLYSGKYNWKKQRAVVFLDPFGMQVPWHTIEELGKTRAIEIILNFPVGMAIQRLLPSDGVFTQDKKDKLTEYFGSSDWEKVVYEDSNDLFGMLKIKHADAGEKLAKWYQERLAKAFGYSSPPRLIKNTKGAHLYYILWAGPNPIGAKIATDVLVNGKDYKDR